MTQAGTVPRSWEIRALSFLKTRSVITHKALGLILCLNFEKIMKDLNEQQATKM
jgi:hypothetical protein